MGRGGGYLCAGGDKKHIIYFAWLKDTLMLKIYVNVHPISRLYVRVILNYMCYEPSKNLGSSGHICIHEYIERPWDNAT